MIRSAALIALAAGATSVQAQSAADYTRLKRAWVGCSRNSYLALREVMPDRSTAAESAMQACATEEEAIYAAGPLDPADERRGRAMLRSQLKALLLQEP